MFGFVRNFQTVFQSGCTILHSHQQWMSVPVASHPLQHLVLFMFWVLGILRCAVVSHYCFMHCFDYYSFVISFGIRKCDTSKIVLAIWDSLIFHVNFKKDISISAKKKVTGILVGISLNLRIILSSVDILII